MARPANPTTPPWINLKESLELVKLIYDRGAGTVSYDDLARIMGNTVKSSSFRMKLLALKTFGLVQSDGITARLTPLGDMIVEPSSPDEYRDSLVKSFNSIPLHASIYQRYKGGYLPEDTFLGNTIVREFDAPGDSRNQWVDCFKESGRAANVLVDEGGKIRVLQAAKTMTDAVTPPKPPPANRGAEDPPPSLPPSQPPPSNESFEVILDDQRVVIIPKLFDRDDLEYLQNVLDLYVKRRESRKAS